MGSAALAGAAAVGIGLAIGIGWIYGDPYYPRLEFLGGERSGFDPTTLDTGLQWWYLVVRGLGLVVLVPLLEEIFWRSFVIRFVENQDDFLKVPVGKVTLLSGAVSAGAFMLVHPEWLAALITGVAWAILLHLTQRLWTCLISHMVANATLGAIVVMPDQWSFL